ncbi:MAG: peptide chain release factor N(5)-glutamine methyltransferase [Bacteriovoracaceae bacterium]|nr:peptide chain release factor N(5)-glutamine methyltransferase [Bacteriovoracaceae bacterium]
MKFFFKKHEKHLADSYPGITLERLLQETSDWKEDWKIIEAQLLKAIPLQYISQKAYFYKSVFFVNENVLIPRSETEILVETVAKHVKKKAAMILDLGTGSGAIILSLKKECPQIVAWASDIDPKALAVAKLNGTELALDVQWVQADRFDYAFPKMDVIVTNPPYIMQKRDLATVHAQVAKYEPHTALFLSDETYDKWYLELFQGALKLLNPNGLFFMEGHEDHLPRLKQLAESLGAANVLLIKDYTQRFRFLTFEVK